MAKNLKDLIDIDLLAYFKSKLDLLFASKVDKENGKGLSSNDYTSDEKTKLANIATGAQVNTIEGIQVVGNTVSPANKIVNIPAVTQSSPGVMTAADKKKLDGVDTGAQVNVIESVKVNGTAQTITGKAVDISVPTTVAELTDANSYATKDYVDTNGGKIDKIKINGKEQTIAGSDKSVDLDIDDIAWFTGTISEVSGLPVVQFTPGSELDFKGIKDALADGKLPVIAAATIATANNGNTIYLPLTKWYQQRAVLGEQEGDYAIFEAIVGTTYHRILLSKIGTAFNWEYKSSTLSTEADAKSKFYTFTTDDSWDTDENPYPVESSATVASILSDYSSGYAVFAVLDGEIVMPLLRIISSTTGKDSCMFGIFDGPDTFISLYYDFGQRMSGRNGWLSEYTEIASAEALESAMAEKVDKEDGKGLSTNDYTTVEKNKLSGIAAGAQVNVVTNASSTGSGASETMTVSKGSTNYTTYTKAALDSALGEKAAASSVYTKTEIDQKLSGAMNYRGTKATRSALDTIEPADRHAGDVWHITADGSEWAWNGTAWEELGTAIDMSGYVEEDNIGLATTSQIDELFTGSGN